MSAQLSAKFKKIKKPEKIFGNLRESNCTFYTFYTAFKPYFEVWTAEICYKNLQLSFFQKEKKYMQQTKHSPAKNNIKHKKLH